MKRIIGEGLVAILPYFEAAADNAKQATCNRAHCGSVIVKNNVIIGKGSNGPALGDETARVCEADLDHSIKQKYDTTCCVHAEWRAIIDTCRQNGLEVEGSRLYFMRIDEAGRFTDAGDPYCTTCSRLTMESGVSEFALWNADGADIYSASEYNQMSYTYYTKKQSR